MSISMQQITSENSKWLMGTGTLVEGILKLPDTLEDIASVLDVSGLCEVEETKILEGQITLMGTANFRVLYLDKNGNFASFDAECNFSHEAEMSLENTTTKILAYAQPADISYGIVDGTSVSIRANIGMDIFAMGNRQYEILDAYSPSKYTCVKNNTAKLSRVKSAKAFKSYIKTEVRVPQSMPEVKRVLTERGYAAIRGAVMEDGRVAVEGEVTVFIVYESTDKNAPLQHFSETLGFAEIINDDGFEKNASLFMMADLDRIGTSCNEENADIIEISAIVSLLGVARVQTEVQYVDDMYDEESEVALDNEIFNTCDIKMCDCQKKIIRLSAQIPDTSPEVSRVLFTKVQPNITSVIPDRDRVLLSGDMMTTLCYTTQETGIKSVRLTLPFETEVAYPGITPSSKVWLKAFGEYGVAEGSGRELEIKCCLDICMWEVSMAKVSAISGAEFTPLQDEKESGVVVYYANGSESLWDIAKKFKVKKDVIGDIPDDAYVEKGKRLVLIRR